jgi:arsenate reductase
MSEVVIYHNPRCSKSRQTLALIRDKGIEPDVILYLEGILTPEDIAHTLDLLGMQPIDIIRKNEAEFKTYFGDADKLSDAELITAMARHPKVIERPIVIARKRAVIGRPPENVLDIL